MEHNNNTVEVHVNAADIGLNYQMDANNDHPRSSLPSYLQNSIDQTNIKTVTIDEAITRMVSDPPIEFLCSNIRKYSGDITSIGTDNCNGENNDNQENDILPALIKSREPYLYAKPRYRFQTSHDNHHLSVPSMASTSLTRRSHSIHVIESSNNSMALHPVKTIIKTTNNGLIPTNNTHLSNTNRRSTIHRFTETSDDLYVPKESWLTSIYIKLPKSKSFCRFQLKLLNLPLFASTVRYLEETATGENKEMLQSNSFLYAVFNQFVPHNRIMVNTLSKHVRRIRKYEILAVIEFNFLRTSSNISGKRNSFTIRHANKRENFGKNINQKFVPYDFNRVILELNPNGNKCSESDYINASHIDSLLKPNAYIVAQGPNEKTMGHFWRMIWQQNIQVIVMLTKVYEFIRVMCIQYWPSKLNQPELFDDRFEVTLIEEDQLADYICRTMKIRDLNADESNENFQTIYQLHFQSWNVTACPYSDSILKFRRRVKLYQNQAVNSGPLLVHCSNGCGRSGTYVCLDANLDLVDDEGVVDIFNYAKNLRNSRTNMIENLEQYRFIYETIEEWYICGKTWFNVSEISQQMKHKSIKNKATKRNEYQAEFEKLMCMTSKFTIGDCAGGHRLENRDKNRDVSIVPPDNFRPYLTSVQSNDQSDYINAVFVDGYSRPREYIVTEWPLKKTMENLWSLIYDHDCNTVVVLGGVPKNDKSFQEFWPRDSKTCKYGPIFTVETISHNNPPKINSWVFRITKKLTSLTELMAGIKAEPKVVQFFEFLAWPYDYKVPISTNALVELIHMVERWRQRTSYGPVLVISGNGKSRVGVYIAANFAIEQVVAHEEIDIFNAVKTVRRHRSALIETIMEYKYCYDLTLHYVSHYMNTDNQVFKTAASTKNAPSL
ncbi:receptor-type tyrosine-protein phosphatase epsilon isoform X2 [Dermatophagoides farinae]|uniref:receptor-type tyrosine-protein phosphatase epsilon isoform X2 n=1 Tax=Dermatophagoides farinae TaxID=6954 RepID=UPI003F63BF3E